MYQVPAARALMGAQFLQYLIYGFLYCVEGCKYEELIQNEAEKNTADYEARH